MYIDMHDDNYIYHIIPIEGRLTSHPDGNRELTVRGRILNVSMVNHNGFGFRTGTSKMIDKVIYNNPATIVYWKDGTKTVVKCDPKDTYDPMTGLALCYMKKFLGNNSRKFNDALHDAGF